MAWLALVGAGCMEVFGVINIKRLSEKKWDALLYMLFTFGLSFILLTYAMQTIPMGTAYAIWTGIGTVGAAFIGMFIYGEARDWKRLVFVAMILGASLGLKLVS
ncbi:QacE family quaternary ammonium compound efflux SMR transporter [Paenibacillus albidus]|uniref:QacE family quaternary ammonium compound efflux SMR transporter n=1 Tax=Paenibacillus albidus TaxID=2041023 RepID=A0A917FQK5_9BACL|nr:multidrug efflux SMR transporter [Paenibacillus albidus]GGF97789.1 QacE family quaternary ammonium compound efflux SMR transporter [Paenibacillus albidus]